MSVFIMASDWTKKEAAKLPRISVYGVNDLSEIRASAAQC
jgi:hypothetical protein